MKHRIGLIGGAVGLGLVLLFITLRVSAVAAEGRPSTPPIVLDLFPQPNSHTVSQTTNIGILYDQPIDPATINSRTFAVHAMQTGLLTDILSVSGGEIQLNPSLPLKVGELIQVIATTGTQNFGGEGPIAPTIWQFQIGSTAGSGIFTISQVITQPIPGALFLTEEQSDGNQSLGLEIYIGLDIGDVDLDGDIDLVLGSGESAKIWLNDGAGNFIDSGQNLDPFWVTGAQLADFDNDGDLDLALLGGGIFVHVETSIWLNDGSGFFSVLSQTLPGAYVNGSNVADIDGDNDIDLIIANNWGSSEIWSNDGFGFFTPTEYLTGTDNTYSVGTGDLDQDGDIDIFAANWEEDRVWLNDGRGKFTATNQLLGDEEGAAVALGDLNGDGSLDAFVLGLNSIVSNGVTMTVWINNGDATFQPNGQTLNGIFSYNGNVTLGDVDGDGDLDALIGADYGVCAGPANQQNELWLNDGSGQFTFSGQFLGGDFTRGVALGDMDGDGDLDAFLGSFGRDCDTFPGNAEVVVWENQNIVVPISGLNAESNSPVELGETAVMTASVVSGTAVAYAWDFGDGMVGSGAMVNHLYGQVGVYDVIVTATNDLNSMTATLSITVTEQSISGLAAESNSPVELGETAVMTASVVSGTAVTYAWDFGDGAVGSGENVSHTYTETGTFSVTVTATNSVSTEAVTIFIVVFLEKSTYDIYMPVALKP